MPIPITLTADTRKQLLASIKRYVDEDLDQEIGDLKAGSLLDYVLKEIGPTIYNLAIADAQTYIQERALDLEGVCYQKEFTFWADLRQEQTKADTNRQRQRP
jgi:uncharacterized protein (DUF2164 family)